MNCQAPSMKVLRLLMKFSAQGLSFSLFHRLASILYLLHRVSEVIGRTAENVVLLEHIYVFNEPRPRARSSGSARVIWKIRW